MSSPDPNCKKCGGAGVLTIDTTDYGECSGWNPGSARVRCECWPMDPEVVKAIEAILAEDKDD